MKKFLAVLLLLVFASVSSALELPDNIYDWQAQNEHVVPLITQPDNINLGRCVHKDYERESPRGEVNIILTEGKGPGSLYVPESVNNSEGVLASTAGYEVIDVAGKRAILETNETLPVSLAIKYDDNITLTIETSSLSKSEVVMFAEKLSAFLN